jgi:hypothetical protein
LTYVSPTLGAQIAVLALSGAATTAPDTTVAGVVKTISWAGPSEVDPSGLITLAANQITFATSGYYAIAFSCPVSLQAAGGGAGRFYLWDTDGAGSEVGGTSTPFFIYLDIGNGEQGTMVTGYWIVNVTAGHAYEVRVKTAAAASLSFHNGAVNYGGDERYQQITFTKLS